MVPEASNNDDTQLAALTAALAAERAALTAERAAHAAAQVQLVAMTQERDQLRASHERLRTELEMLKRRIFIAKAERVDTVQLELEFAEKLRKLDALAGTLGDDDVGEDDDESPSPDNNKRKTDRKHRSTGRRDLSKLPLEETRVEITDPLYEELVAKGAAQRVGFVDSYKLGRLRGGMRRIVIARAKYQVVDPRGKTAIDVAPVPVELFPRSLAAPSLLAHIIMEKYGKGLPLFRIEDTFSREGCPVDRGTMCRWIEDAGSTCGATVIHAARQHALQAFCIATDATGVLVQPIRTHEKVRKPCARGHYFVSVADRDHVFLDYTPKETSVAVRKLFEGYSGYVQADAKSVYDALFRPPETKESDGEAVAPCIEVACWSHFRRGYWEAATANKSVVAREALVRIGRIFELDATWRGKPPTEIKRLRALHLRPHADALFAWIEVEHEKVAHQRGLLRSALGYGLRQREALLRFFEDGRLVLDNNRSERALRGTIAIGRKAWLFVGSDDHAQSAGHLFSLIASCKLHGLDPELYLRDLFRVLPHGPTDRYLELTPKFWAATRARLDPDQLKAELGPLTVPSAASTPEEQSAANNPA